MFGPISLLQCPSSSLFPPHGAGWRTDNLIDALVVEPDRVPSGSEKHGDSIANDQATRMVHLEPAPAVELDGEHLERRPLGERVPNVVKVFSRHRLPFAGSKPAHFPSTPAG